MVVVVFVAEGVSVARINLGEMVLVVFVVGVVVVTTLITHLDVSFSSSLCDLLSGLNCSEHAAIGQSQNWNNICKKFQEGGHLKQCRDSMLDLG